MPTFFARRYARRVEQIGRPEKLIGLFVLLLLAGIVASFVGQVLTDRNYLFTVDPATFAEPGSVQPVGAPGDPARATVMTDSLFPDPGVDGWRAPVETRRFTPGNLHLKIDGRASIYLDFQVVSLTFGSYFHRADRGRTADVYWYNMGTPANALGLYRIEASPGATALSIGDRGYQAGTAVFFCKGASYVQILPSGLDEADAQAALAIADRIAEIIEDAPESASGE